ncbi:hypothetical protein CCMA1212_004116 [Trichoderma ghanense]|uniref:DUF676 domain-containing protein n=1 Tax=Trichoderma ghanense TaxID=65468 RepID=A0ABY2H6T8_9HYPO
MASTADSAKSAHKVKRSGKSLYQRNSLGVAAQPSTGLGQTGQAAAQGRPDEARPPLVVSDIVPPAVRHPHVPVETPVPLPATLPMAMRTTATFSPATTFPTATATTSPGAALQREALAADERILKAQKDWERQQQAFIESQVPIPEPSRRTPEPFRPLPPSPPVRAGMANTSSRAESPEILRVSEEPFDAATDDMAGPKALPMLNKPATADAKVREPRARPASSSTSASIPAASASSSDSLSASASVASDPGDVIETEDGETIRVGLQTNAEGRSYYTYLVLSHTMLMRMPRRANALASLPDDDGNEQNTLNAPFPPGKERCEEVVEGGKRPFICPVRDCRTLSWVLRHLSNHFHGKHNRGLFNDNGDGTISKIGSYENEGLSSPGIIVSRKPLPPGAPPPAEPNWKFRGKSSSKKSPPTLKASVSATASQSMPESVPQSAPQSAAPPDLAKRSLRSDTSNDAIDDRAAKRPKTATPVPLPTQISPILLSTPQSPPPTTPPAQVLRPPMTDVLRYLHSHLSPAQQVPARPDVLALSRYKQVRRVPGLWWEHHRGKTLDPLNYACILAYLVGRAEEMDPCRRWKGISRLAEPSVALPPDLPAEAKAAFSRTETCIACQYQLCCYRLKNECEWGNRDDQGLDSAAEEAASQQNHEPAVTNNHGDRMDLDDGIANVQASTTQFGQYAAQSQQKQDPQLAASALEASARKLSSAEVEDFEKMEDWEMAPGTTKEEETNLNAIFSNAYMASQNPIAVSPRYSANVLCLKPGQSHHWPVEVSKARMCYVCSGKISVKIGAGEPVKLGPIGLILIRPGQTCRCNYSEATAMAPGGRAPLQRPRLGHHGTSPSRTQSLTVPRPTTAHRSRSARTFPGSILSDTDETELKPDDGSEEQQHEKPQDDSDGVEHLRFTLDPAGRLTHDQTGVDIVTVPCPGADALRSWNRDGLMGRYFGNLSMRDVEVREAAAERRSPSWVREGIRREASRARILLYEHPGVREGTTLNSLAMALLEELRALRAAEKRRDRPLLFIAHSIGGLVVKMALVKAHTDPRYGDILHECYGVAFFGTPHQGSSYFAMQALAGSIQHLLQLSVPLPASLTDQLRMGNPLLLHVDEDFKLVSDDLRVWTLFETIDSRLSANSGDLYYTAPLTSPKSAILGMRQERIFPLQSDHANVASFGRHNARSLNDFLKQLVKIIDKADSSAKEDSNGCKWTLHLDQKVAVEVHGFFDEAGMEDGAVRAWSTRLPLKEFLSKGPEACLSERLNEVELPPEEGRFLAVRGRTGLVDMEGPPTDVSFPPDPQTVKNALGINQGERAHPHEPVLSRYLCDEPPLMAPVPPSPLILPVDSPRTRPRMSTESAPMALVLRPDAVPLASTPPSRPISLPPRQSTPFHKPSPLLRASLEQELAIDRLSPPVRVRLGRNSFSRSMSLDSQTGAPTPHRASISQRSRSTFHQAPHDEDGDDCDDEGLDASPKLPESVIEVRRMAKERRHRASGSATVDESAVVDEGDLVDDVAHGALMRPQAKARKFVWIHLPYNNPTWVTDILKTLQVSYMRDFSDLSNHDFWVRSHTRGRHSQHYAHYAKPGCYFTPPRTASPRAHSVTSSPHPLLGEDDQMSICLFLPYLHFDSYKRLIRRRELISKRLAHGRARPIPESVAKSDSLELQVIWEFLGHDPPINCRRTLDQFGYPSLRDTRSRDDDQMLYKLTKERYRDPSEYQGLFNQSTSDVGSGGSSNKSGSGSGSGSGGRSGASHASWRDKLTKEAEENGEEETEKDVLNGNVLMVDQLWLWTISTHTLLSFFPKRESDPMEGPLYQQADLRDSIFNDVNVDLTRICDNALDLAALAAFHAVSVLLDRSSHPDLEVFRIFEEAISVLTEKLTTSLKEFRSEGFRDKAFDYEPVENKARSIRQRHQEEGRRAERENRDNTSALLELRDIEDELATLLTLFERQTRVISSMHGIYNRSEMQAHTVHGRKFLHEALKRLAEYSHTTEEMVKRVRNTRDEYDKLLQMMQRQAQVDEVRLSRLHADLASAQSRSVLIFTTFTVIFLPLQFFTGIFGMNTREWGGGDNLPLQTIGVIGIPASVALILVTLIVAWSTTARRFFKWIGRNYGYAMLWLYRTVGKPVAKKAMKVAAKIRPARRQGVGRSEERDARRRLSTEMSDFWERHRLERERGYRIPEVNRVPVVSRAKGGERARLKRSLGR